LEHKAASTEASIVRRSYCSARTHPQQQNNMTNMSNYVKNCIFSSQFVNNPFFANHVMVLLHRFLSKKKSEVFACSSIVIHKNPSNNRKGGHLVWKSFLSFGWPAFYLMKKSKIVIHQPSLKFSINMNCIWYPHFGDWLVKKEVGL
jgi:hypothetical protein